MANRSVCIGQRAATHAGQCSRVQEGGMAHLQVPLDEIIRWHDSPISDEFKSADLPQNWFAVVYKRWDDIWIAILGCRTEPESLPVCDVFARFGSAQGWIEDKA